MEGNNDDDWQADWSSDGERPTTSRIRRGAYPGPSGRDEVEDELAEERLDAAELVIETLLDTDDEEDQFEQEEFYAESDEGEADEEDDEDWLEGGATNEHEDEQPDERKWAELEARIEEIFAESSESRRYTNSTTTTAKRYRGG